MQCSYYYRKACHGMVLRGGGTATPWQTLIPPPLIIR